MADIVYLWVKQRGNTDCDLTQHQKNITKKLQKLKRGPPTSLTKAKGKGIGAFCSVEFD